MESMQRCARLHTAAAANGAGELSTAKDIWNSFELSTYILKQDWLSQIQDEKDGNGTGRNEIWQLLWWLK
jgi:hypothetical protein